MKIKYLVLSISFVFASFTNILAQIDTISVDIFPAASGLITGDGEYFTGSLVNLEATPNTGYNFINWSENGVNISDDSNYSFISFGNRQLTANFELKSYIIGTTSLPVEGGFTNGGGIYSHGSLVTLQAIKNIGYSFLNWTENNVEISSDSILTMTALNDVDYVANFALNNYLINASSVPVGSGNVEGTGNFNHGDSVFLKAVPLDGYQFDSWSENGAELSSDSLYKFIAVTNRSLTANFSLKNYSITATALPIIGGTTSGAGIFTHGTEANLIATPASGYFFSNWTEGDSVVSIDSNYLFLANSDRNLVANFSEVQFLVTTKVNPALSGITTGDSNYTNLSFATVAAYPNIGWEFNNWSENDNILAADTAYSFIVLQNRELTANFRKKIYSLNADPFPTEGGIVDGTGFFPHDSLITISADASIGWHFINWTENDSIISIDSIFSFNLLKERDLVANFEKNIYQVSTLVYPEMAGNTIGDSLYTFGDSVNLVAVPNTNSGWEFVNWTKGEIEISQDSVLTFLSNDNVNLIANFKLKDYSVNLSSFPANAGKVEGVGVYTHGESVTISAVPEAGWLFANWMDGENNISSDPELTFSINETKNLTANFAHELYSLNSTPDPAEAGYVTGSGTFYYNQTTTLIPVANPGWEFVNWTENDAVISTDSLLNLSITKNTLLKANFKQIDYSISCLANPVEGGITLGCGISRYNKEIELTATPNDGWEFVNWTENGEIISILQDYKFNVIEHRNIVANFQLATSLKSLENENIVPEEYYLSNAYPNPFNPTTNINFGLPEASSVKITVSDINGQIVRTILRDEFLAAGNYSTNFNAEDLSSGIYLYVILAKGDNSSKIFKKVHKLILLK